MPVRGETQLLTDLYQLTMLDSYRTEGMDDIAVFEFFVRRLPPQRNFLIAAGLEPLLAYLTDWHFNRDEIDWLVAAGHCDTDFADYLAQLRFCGDVDAMPEGTVFFADEPVVRITAPIAQAQLIESRLINILHYQIVVASKAARCVLAAHGKRLIDFGMRRAHGAEAALFAARASYLAGFDGSATVLAAREYGIPAFGTMAHSYIQAHHSESAAFAAFAQRHPHNCTLLIDTYDTVRGAERVIELLPQLRAAGTNVQAVRLDSGDLDALSRAVRARLDAAGYRELQIFASGGLDEMSIAQLLKNNAPIDGFGVGTALTVSSDAPALDCAYKLQEYAGIARRKRSPGKSTWPGRKQVFRDYAVANEPNASHEFACDVLALAGADRRGDALSQTGEPLLQAVMRGGERVGSAPTLLQSRAYCAQQLAHLPRALRELTPAKPYPVQIGADVRALAQQVDAIFE